MKMLGFDITLKVRKAPPPLPRSIVVPLVRLASGKNYSVPVGTVGVVEDTFHDEQTPAITHFVRWATGGGSGPIFDGDLERLGEITVPLED